MTTTKTKQLKQSKQSHPAKPLPVEIPPAPAAEQDEIDDFEDDEVAESTTNHSNHTNEEKQRESRQEEQELQEENTQSDSETPVIPEIPVENSVPAPTSAEAHLDKIKAARAVVADRERIYLSKKSQAKQAKEAFEEAVADLTEVIDDGEEYLPLFDAEAGGRRPEAEGGVESGPTVAMQPTALPENNAWRAVSVDQLGLSGKITDKLIEAGCQTIGELEDRRASHKGLRSISGIGEKKITVIEDAILKWLTENRDKEVFDRSAAVAAATTTDDLDDSQAASSYDAEFDAELAKQIHRRATELDNGVSGGLHQKLADSDYWADGKKAYNDGEPLESCNWMAGDQQDDWIRGWLFAAPVTESPASADKTAEKSSADKPAVRR